MTAAPADLPPYDPQRIVDAPFPERVRLACVTWANASPKDRKSTRLNSSHT